MDNVSKEDNLPHDEASLEPPTLIGYPLDFGYVPQGSHKTLRQIISNTTKKPMIWLADAGESKWLSIEPDHGILPPGGQQPIRVTADAATLAVGEHFVTLTFSSEGDEASMSKHIGGNIMVGKPAPLSLGAGLHFGWLKPQSISTLEMIIDNPDDHEVDWEIHIGQGKLGLAQRTTLEHGRRKPDIMENFSIKNVKGVILSKDHDRLGPHASQTIYVTASAAKLKPGYAYKTWLTLLSKAVGNSAESTSVEIPIEFHVTICPYNDGGPKVPCDLPSHISFTIPHMQPDGTYTLNLTNDKDNESTVSWAMNSPYPPLPDWLVPSQKEGVIKVRESTSVVLTARRAGLTTGTYKAQLYLTFKWVDQNNLPVGDGTTAPPISVFLTVE